MVLTHLQSQLIARVADVGLRKIIQAALELRNTTGHTLANNADRRGAEEELVRILDEECRS